MLRPRLNIQEQQLQLAFMGESEGEALRTAQQGAELCTAKCSTERPAREEGLMEEVCERSNLLRAWKRVRENQGSPQGNRILSCSGEHCQQIVFVQTT